MPRVVRCKFRCESVEPSEFGANQKTVKFWAHYDESIPEDQRFSTATPSGHLEFELTNPAVEDFFVPGDTYYLDIIKAEAPVPALT